MTVVEDATIVWARGHIHQGGTEVVLTLNGKDVCVSTPTYNSEGIISSMSICPKPIPLKKGDTFSLRGTYDLTKHELYVPVQSSVSPDFQMANYYRRKSTDSSGGAAKGTFGLGVSISLTNN
jgi:hypothetical protein